MHNITDPSDVNHSKVIANLVDNPRQLPNHARSPQ